MYCLAAHHYSCAPSSTCAHTFMQVAFLFNAFEDSFQAPGISPHNLWCSDPWALLLHCRPGMVGCALLTQPLCRTWWTAAPPLLCTQCSPSSAVYTVQPLLCCVHGAAPPLLCTRCSPSSAVYMVLPLLCCIFTAAQGSWPSPHGAAVSAVRWAVLLNVMRKIPVLLLQGLPWAACIQLQLQCAC